MEEPGLAGFSKGVMPDVQIYPRNQNPKWNKKRGEGPYKPCPLIRGWSNDGMNVRPSLARQVDGKLAERYRTTPKT